MPSINILTWHNGSGLQQDSQCLADILTRAGFTVIQTDLRPSRHKHQRLSRFGLLGRLWEKSIQIYQSYRYRARKKLNFVTQKTYLYDVNLFLEFVDTRRFSQARKNCFIPNQEWFSSWRHLTLKSFDQILCKTLHAYDIFQRLGHSTSYISFTSPDRYRYEFKTDYNTCLHLAGRSPLKGTQAILDVWRQHPEWPQLYVIQRSSHAPVAWLPDNISYIQKHVDLEVLTEMQNRCGLRIQTSEAEGFGHVLVEGMSCGAVMVTTDAPPMHEIVTPDRGFLVAYDRSTPKDLGRRYYVDPDQLEKQLDSIFRLSLEQRRKIGQRARDWYLENDHLFKQNIIQVMHDLLKHNLNDISKHYD
ncbi:MAG: glycosyltransferase family 4 protein [Coleofasciculaceae cyanobacterium RL_1_1]|nr:glycosyltransferase family 4 protein [Coleofasciculaceae cyanobacterium RL_1_1]